MTASLRPPPFRAEHIGSLLRPEELVKQRYAIADGSAEPDSLIPVEQKAVKDVVKLQLDCGIQSLTNGEVSWSTASDLPVILAEKTISTRGISSGALSWRPSTEWKRLI